MNKIILSDVLDFILTTKDNDTLVTINEAVKDRLSTNSSRLKYELEPGDKVNRTRALVITYWNDKKTKFHVPFTMLTKIITKGASDE